VDQALRTIQHFEAKPTDATAYDTSLAVGPSHLVVAVNYSVVVLSKDGTLLKESPLLAWFKSKLTADVDRVFDPRLLYDQYEDRWVLTASAVHYGTKGTPDFFTSPHFVLSVSVGSDPTGDWWTWAYPEPQDATGATPPFPDHPTVGVDPRALYVTANMSDVASLQPKPTRARLWVIPKEGLYDGADVTHTEFFPLMDPTDEQHEQETFARTVFPCHTWGTPGVQFLVSTRSDGTHAVEQSIVLRTLTHDADGPRLRARSVPVLEYGLKVPAAPQPGGIEVNTGSDARVRSAIYMGGSVWFAFAALDGDVSAARWYQLDPTGAANPAIVQQGNHAAPNVHHCYPAIVPDMHGNAALVVGRATGGEPLSLHVSARKVSDPPSELPPTTLLHAGTAVHDHHDTWGRNRWGDYHAAALDPSDGATIWVCGGYPVTADSWGVCVGKVRV
jgi:hypothetical protein